MSTIGVKAIKYPDGDSAIDITDGGNVTLAGTLGVTGRTTSANSTVGSGTASTYVDLTINGASTSNYGPLIVLQSAGTALSLIHI